MTLNQGELSFFPRLIYPVDDYKLEYRGAVKDDYIPHGQGTLVLKNGMPLTCHWTDGSSAELLGIKSVMKGIIKRHTEDKTTVPKHVKNIELRKIREKLSYHL